jgi:hypothetical protein
VLPGDLQGDGDQDADPADQPLTSVTPGAEDTPLASRSLAPSYVAVFLPLHGVSANQSLSTAGEQGQSVAHGYCLSGRDVLLQGCVARC